MFDYEYWGNGTFSMKTNMELEEVLLRHSAINKVATVRFWDTPKDSVVLGYAQATDVIKRPGNSFDVARRITGGSHVQFGPNCLAYTFTVPRDGNFGNFEDMRKFFAENVANALIELGIDSAEADNKASSINIDGKVVAGHAIFWGVESALMHGLVIMNPYDVDKILSRVMLQERKIGKNIYPESSALKNIPALSQFLGEVVKNVDENMKTFVAKKIVAEKILEQVTGGKHKLKDIDKILQETKLVERNPPWVNERKPPFTPEEVESIPGEELDGPLKKNLGYCLYIQVDDKDFKKMAEPSE